MELYLNTTRNSKLNILGFLRIVVQIHTRIYARLIFKVPKLIFRLSSAENYLKISSRKNYAKLSLIMIGLKQTDKNLIHSFLGIHFKVDMNTVLQPFVSLGLRTFFTAVDSMLHNQNQMDQFERNYRQTRLNFSLNCQG